MALAIYLRANATEKVINYFMQTGDYENIIKYAAKVDTSQTTFSCCKTWCARIRRLLRPCQAPRVA